jgi:hypothetical protein
LEVLLAPPPTLLSDFDDTIACEVVHVELVMKKWKATGEKCKGRGSNGRVEEVYFEI